ncbi:MAG: acyltransferase family protein [Cyclobacteriaceae bacterium]
MRIENRILGLDILRSIAITQVLLIHSVYLLPDIQKEWLLKVIPTIDGVSIFFVLSGFLIGGILLREIENKEFELKNLAQFWMRRWFRTLPNYFLIILILFLYDILIYKTNSHLSFRYLFFAQNFFSNHPDFFPEAWSLSVEEWFYLLFPGACYILFKVFTIRRHAVFASILFFLLIPFFLRTIAIFNYNDDLILRNVVIFRLDSLMYGVVGAYLFRSYSKIWNGTKNQSLLVSIILLLLLFFAHLTLPKEHFFWRSFVFNIESIVTLAALPFFSNLKRIRFTWLAKTFTFISIVSYSMYVLNLSIIQWRIIPIFLSITNLRSLDPILLKALSFFLFWPFLIVSSYLMFRFYERPMTNLRDYFATSGNNV